MHASAKTVRSRWSNPSCQSRKRRSIIFWFHPLHLLPRGDQDRTTQPHLAPCRERPVLWFRVGVGCLRLGYREFVNRRSAAHNAPTAGGNALTNYHGEQDLACESARATLRFDAALGYGPTVGANIPQGLTLSHTDHPFQARPI
jgi:hypothetical protein